MGYIIIGWKISYAHVVAQVDLSKFLVTRIMNREGYASYVAVNVTGTILRLLVV